MRYFNEAKSFGDILIVTITPDSHVNKGPGRPIFSESLRAEAISELASVDHVSINLWENAVETIRLVKPNYYVKGPDYRELENDPTGGIYDEKSAIEEVGGQLKTTTGQTFSSTNLINRSYPRHSEEVNTFLESFSDRYPIQQAVDFLTNATNLKILVLGETIIDEYVYCSTLGKTGKEPVLAAKELGSEKFAGGIIAVANNIASFNANVSMLTCIGSANSQYDFVCEKLDQNIETFFVHNKQAPTIIKRRFIENYPFQKLFETYIIDDSAATAEEIAEFKNQLDSLLPQFDLVIVTDYGHGMIGPDEVDILRKKSQFLCVNTQVNAGNLGFNTASKYAGADFLCVSEDEIRLDARDKTGNLQNIVETTSTKLDCQNIIITRGQEGCLCYSNEEGFSTVPAISTEVRDRIGAGDALFAVASLLACQKAPIELAGFIGNIAGAQAVSTVGHRTSLSKISLIKHVESLLK